MTLPLALTTSSRVHGEPDTDAVMHQYLHTVGASVGKKVSGVRVGGAKDLDDSGQGGVSDGARAEQNFWVSLILWTWCARLFACTRSCEMRDFNSRRDRRTLTAIRALQPCLASKHDPHAGAEWSAPPVLHWPIKKPDTGAGFFVGRAFSSNLLPKDPATWTASTKPSGQWPGRSQLRQREPSLQRLQEKQQPRRRRHSSRLIPERRQQTSGFCPQLRKLLALDTPFRGRQRWS